MALLSRSLPFGNQAGLSLLLAAGSSAVAVRAANIALGVALPAYCSVRALEDRQQMAQRKWLAYWSVYGCFHAVETTVGYLVSWLPFYQHAKLGLLVWLQLPPNMGFVKVYSRFLRPLFHQHRKSIDPWLAAASRSLDAWRSAHQSELQAASGLLQRAAAAARSTLQAGVRALSGATPPHAALPDDPLADLSAPPSHSNPNSDSNPASSPPSSATAEPDTISGSSFGWGQQDGRHSG